MCVVRRTPSHCSTTHSHTTCYAATTPRLQIRIELWYCNITLARNKAPWWWSDKIETCRSVLKLFYVKLYVHSLVDKLKWFYENARCYNKIYRTSFITAFWRQPNMDIRMARCSVAVYFFSPAKFFSTSIFTNVNKWTNVRKASWLPRTISYNLPIFIVQKMEVALQKFKYWHCEDETYQLQLMFFTERTAS